MRDGTWLRYLRFLGPRVERDVTSELRFHADMLAKEYAARGMTDAEVQAAVARRLGDVAAIAAECATIGHRAERRRTLHEVLESVWYDLRFVLRGLRRSPGFTAIIVTTFALGIGANAAMFGIVDRVLLSAPPGIANPDGVVRIYFDRPAAGMTATLLQQATFPSLMALRARDAGFADVAMYEAESRVFGTGVDARKIHALAVTPNTFSMLGVRPALGRFFGASEDVPPAGTPVAVLGYAFWRSQFGGARDVLGRVIVVDSTHYTIVGVGPEGFTGVDIDPVDIMLPLATTADGDDPNWNTARYMLWVSGVARMRPGANIAAAAAEATHIIRTDAMSLDGKGSMDSRATVRLGPIPRALGPETGQARTRGRVAEWLSGVSLVLLLVACANVANLLLARALRRRREIAVRVALGVGRARLTFMLFMESILLAAGGGAAGFIVASVGGRALRTVLLPDAAPDTLGFDPHVAGVAALAVLATGLVTGVAPMLQVGRRDIGAALKSGVREGGGRQSRLRVGLLVAQTALSVMLLVGAGLFVRSLRNIRTMNYGYDPARLLLVTATFHGGMTAEARSAAWDRLVARARTLPGVSHAALAMTAPFWSSMSGQVHLPNGDSLSQTAGGRPYVNAVSPDYFVTMGTRVLDGRAFSDADRADGPPVVIVNRTLASVAYPGQRAVGSCLRLGGDSTCSEIVGVVEDQTQRDLHGEATMQYDVPIARTGTRGFRVIMVRTAGDPAMLREPIRRALTAAEPSVEFIDPLVLQDRIEPQVRPWTLGATLSTIFGALALATAMIGLYSVVPYGVAQRTHEFGVRAALGASASGLLRLVLAEGVRVALVGVAIGGALAVIGTRWIASLLFDVRRDDPLVFGIVGATLFAAAVMASLVPAWRAARVDPAAALREE